jgi:hypothetical protein
VAPLFAPVPANGWATILWHTYRMPDEDHRYPSQRSVTEMVSAEGIAARLAELPTRKEITMRCCSASRPALASCSVSRGSSASRVVPLLHIA